MEFDMIKIRNLAETMDLTGYETNEDVLTKESYKANKMIRREAIIKHFPEFANNENAIEIIDGRLDYYLWYIGRVKTSVLFEN